MTEICTKCNLRCVDPPFKEYNESVCWIYYLKAKGFYKQAFKEIKDKWFDWHTGLLKLKLGWSFVEHVWVAGMFIAVLTSKNLNKTPKTNNTLEDFFSDWEIKIADEYLGEVK